MVGVPNCVNLRKRLTVPLGRGKWSPMADWYEQPSFRGHVREPDALRDRLRRQLASPVRWSDCVDSLAELGAAVLYIADELDRRYGHDEACRITGYASMDELRQQAAQLIAKGDGTGSP